MSYYCKWCGQEVLSSNHLCPQAAQHDINSLNDSHSEQNNEIYIVYIVFYHFDQLNPSSINSIWKSKELATIRASSIGGWVEGFILNDWSL